MNGSTSLLLQSPAPIFSSLALLVVLGVFNLLAGVLYQSREAANGKQPLDLILVWGAAVSVTISLFVLAWTGFDIRDAGLDSTVVWKLGWILPRREAGAIALGARADMISVTASGLAALMSLLVVVFLAVEKRGRVALLLVASTLFGQAAASLSWLSVGPWLSFPALMLAMLSGCIGLGLQWRSDASAEEVSRFALERACGLLLAVAGVAILPSKGVGNPAFPDTALLGTSMHGHDAFVGMMLFVLGVSSFFQPFPLLGRLTRPSVGGSLGSLFLGSALPAWVALGAMVRNYDLIEATGLPPLMGWAALAFGLLAAISGVFQKNWASSAGLLISSLFLAAVAALGFGGVIESLTLGAGPLVAGLGFSVLGVAAEGARTPVNHKNKSAPAPGASRAMLLWGILFAWAIGGGLGFVGAGGWLSVLSGAVDSSSVLVGGGLALFALCAVLSAHAVSLVISDSAQKSWDAPPSRIFILAVCTLALLGLVWTGRLSGLSSDMLQDSLFSGLLTAIIGVSKRADAGVQAVLSGLAIPGFALAFWGGGVFRRWLDSFRARAPRFSRFVASGYAMDHAFSWFMTRLKVAGFSIQKQLDEKLLGSVVPEALGSIISLIGIRAGRWDVSLTNGISRFSRFGIAWFSAGVQSVQTGNLQWYVAVGLGSVVVLLIHFLLGRA